MTFDFYHPEKKIAFRLSDAQLNCSLNKEKRFVKHKNMIDANINHLIGEESTTMRAKIAEYFNVVAQS